VSLVCDLDEMLRRRHPDEHAALMPLAEAKRHTFAVDLFCRAQDCFAAPGYGERTAFCADHQWLALAAQPALIEDIDLDTEAPSNVAGATAFGVGAERSAAQRRRPRR
jgi:hypothetical protein